MCDVKAQEDEGPEEGEIQDDDDEENASLCLSSSSSSYERDIRYHERQRAARKYLAKDSAGSISMCIVNDRMLSRTNHERRERSRVRSKHTESSHHKTSSQPRSGLTHGKENRHVHQGQPSRDSRSSPVHHRPRTKSRTPDRSPQSRDHSKTVCKHHRNVADTASSRTSEPIEREVVVTVKCTRKRARVRPGKRVRDAKRSLSSDTASSAKKPKAIQNAGGSDLNNDAVISVGTIDASEENSLKRKLLTMGALANQPETVTVILDEPCNEGVVEIMPNISLETEAVQKSSVAQVSQEKSNGVAPKKGSGADDAEAVIFIATIPKSAPELVTLSDSDVEQDTTQEVEINDITKGTTDMEMSHSSASSNVDMDLDSTVTEVTTNSTPAPAQLDHDEEDIVSLRRAALMSKNKPSKDPEPDEDDLQLRVAALRSAVMRKAEVRKKRRMQAVGQAGQVLGDETTPVDMDLADTDDEQEAASPELPALPLPPLPSEELLNAMGAPCFFSDPQFMPSFLEQPLEKLPLLPSSEMPLFPMGPESAPPADLVLRFPPLDCEGVAHLGFPESGFQAPVPHDYLEFPHPPPMEFPVPPPASIEFPLSLPPPGIDYQPEPSVEYESALPTPYQDPADRLPENWNQEENQAPAQLEPLSALLTKAMKKKLQNTRPNLLEIKVNQPEPVPKKSKESTVDGSTPLAVPSHKVEERKLERQPSIDEDEKSLRERLLKAMSSKRDQTQLPAEKPLQSEEPDKNLSDKTSNLPAKAVDTSRKLETKDKSSMPPPANRSKKEVSVAAKPKTTLSALSKVNHNARQPFPVRKPEKQKIAAVFPQPPVTRFIIQLGEDSDSSDGLDTEEAEDVRKEPMRPTNMYHMKDYCPRSGPAAGDTEKAPEEPSATSNANPISRSDLDLSKEVDKFLKDVRSSHEAATPVPESPTPSQVTVLKPIHVTPLAVRHLPASKQEEYRKLRQLYAERELHNKAQKPNALQAQKLGSAQNRNALQAQKPSSIQAQKPNAPLTQKPISIQTQKPNALVTQKPSSIQAQKSNALVTQKPSSPQAQKPNALLTQKLSPIQAQKLNALQAQKLRSLQAQKLNALQAQKLRSLQAQKLNALQAQKLNALQAQKPIALLPEKPCAPQAQKLSTLQAQEHSAPQSKTVQSGKTSSPQLTGDKSSQQVSKATAVPGPLTPPKTSTPSSSVVSSPSDRPPNHIENPKAIIAKKSLPPPEVSTPERASNPDYFLGAPIIYGQSAPSSILTPSLAPSLPLTNQVNRTAKDATNSVPSTSAPSAPIPPTKSTTTLSAPGNMQSHEKQLEETEMNLLKQRSAVVGQIMGLTRLQDETENAMAAQDVCENNLLRVLADLDAACKKWQESSNNVKSMLLSVKEKRDQLRRSYARTEALARTCKSLGAQVRGKAYSLPVGSMMQSKQKAANEQYGKMIKWRKAELRRIKLIINRTDLAYAFLRSACLQAPSVRGGAAPVPSNPVTSATKSLPLPPTTPPLNKPVPTSTNSVTSSTTLAPKSVPSSAPTATAGTTSRAPNCSTAPSAVPTAAHTPVVLQLPPTTPKPVSRRPETENSSKSLPEPEDVAESDGKGTPLMFCARRLIRVAKKRLREGGKPRETVKQTNMVLGEGRPTEEKRLLGLTKYDSPLDHLGNTGSGDVSFDPEAILCPYELNVLHCEVLKGSKDFGAAPESSQKASRASRQHLSASSAAADLLITAASARSPVIWHNGVQYLHFPNH